MAVPKRSESVEGLQLSIFGQEIAVLTHYSGGKNILAFSPHYVQLPTSKRNTFTLTQLTSDSLLHIPIISRQRIPPVLSNLLPEGALKNWTATSLKVHPENEFPLLAHMGKSLPGAIEATPIPAGQLPSWALDHREQVEPVQIEVDSSQNKFSLAGVQMKFSSLARKDGRFTVGVDANGDSWVIKTPSTVHRHVPMNEFSVMQLAAAVGIEIPETKLVDLAQLDGLPEIKLPEEQYAYAIKRFDRDDGKRIHTEDFAQIFQLYAHDKYGKKNYEQIADVLFKHAVNGLQDVQQMARRLLVNILLANGDAHLKNWSVIYADGKRPKLSPAYDILMTLPYVDDEKKFALNMAKNKNWYEANLQSFETWSIRVGIPWRAIQVHLLDVIDKARANWPSILNDLPMADTHKSILRKHWQKLHNDFRIK